MSDQSESDQNDPVAETSQNMKRNVFSTERRVETGEGRVQGGPCRIHGRGGQPPGRSRGQCMWSPGEGHVTSCGRVSAGAQPAGARGLERAGVASGAY